MPVADVARFANRLVENIETVVVGKRSTISLAIAAVMVEGHVLLEDVPGTAKTMLARALARSIGGTFKRIQCTPDLLPTDVTGVSVFNPKSTEFEFRPGPLFAQVVLADEINRATPRTQSALLEAMAEGSVSVDGQTFELERPFVVLATQNPIDHEGTFPLPEAQLDRFLMRLTLGYPAAADESVMLERLQVKHPIHDVRPVAKPQELLEAQAIIRETSVDEKVRKYILDIVHGTREHEDVALGGSPRASIALFRAGQALARMRGRDFVLPDDVKKLVQPVLAHRLILRPESRLRKQTALAVIQEVVSDARVPMMPQPGDVDHFND